jgi:hypothetical protein
MRSERHQWFGSRIYRELEDPSMTVVCDFLLDSFGVSYRMQEKRRLGSLNVFEAKERAMGNTSRSIEESLANLLKLSGSGSPLFEPRRIEMRPTRLSARHGDTILALKPYGREGYLADETDRQIIKDTLDGRGAISDHFTDSRASTPHVTAGVVAGTVDANFPANSVPKIVCSFSQILVQIYSVEEGGGRVRNTFYDGPVQDFEGLR